MEMIQCIRVYLGPGGGRSAPPAVSLDGTCPPRAGVINPPRRTLMKKNHFFRRFLCLMLVLAMAVGFAMPAFAAPAGSNVTVSVKPVDDNEVSASLRPAGREEITPEESPYADTDMVRVSIILNKASTIEAGFSPMNIAENASAMSYRAGLKKEQTTMVNKIEKAIKADLDVVWNLTLAANVISANVPYGQIARIEKLAGVKRVILETQYLPTVAEQGTANPNMATSGVQTGTSPVWAAGYTGAGMRIAVIDTGTDTDHRSMSAAAYEYALAQLAEAEGMSYDAYVATLDLLDAEKVAAVAGDLNVTVDPAAAYFNSKLPFGYNYVDSDYDIVHDNDEQGEHGSHVAGIATANSYVQMNDGTFAKAMDVVLMQGVAPEAQLLTMKVFGKTGGAYDSDYMAAIEDAIVLGADAVNLSLGTVAPGRTVHADETYQAIMDSLVDSGVVVCISAGNSGTWVEGAENGGYLYSTDVNMDTVGAPGSFTNSLAVASVENDGIVGYYVAVGGNMIVYNENLFNDMQSFTQIAGEYEYIFLDGIGSEEDWAAVDSVLDGKVAICSRGETNFVDKARLAVDAGAVAVLIYNNASGIINLDMTQYPYTQPVAALTKKQGAQIRAASTPVNDENGNLLYLTGTMTISSTIGTTVFGDEYYTMSDFSSWGVPGSLQLKPEVTAPGGNIYSLNGLEPSGTGYEIMSGTSMASPQVAGLAALATQYVEEKGLVAKTGVDERHLIQSLLMSTAEPLLAGEASYYPVIQQGAGLVNINNVITADSYILMAEDANSGAADGKVKVELGDDPAKTGAYSATFTIYNMEDEAKTIDLGADFFIQTPVSDGSYLYMDTTTTLIGMDVTWTVDGKTYVPMNKDGLDFNGDGKVNTDDGQTLLDYATGIPTTVYNQDKADLDLDGDIDSYDAYLFLRDLSAATAALPANGSAEITVEFSIPEDFKPAIDEAYPNGTYVEGFLFAETRSDAEGVAGTAHSIPVLGFYGNWTDPSMFDVGEWAVYATEEEGRIPYIGRTRGNDFKIVYEEEPGYAYSFGGNPLIPDDHYMPERNAINSADSIYGVSFVAIRPAINSRVDVINETTGKELLSAETGPVSAAYYYAALGMWQNSGLTLTTNFKLNSAAEDDVISMAFTMAPEYYQNADGTTNWDALGEGASLDISMVIDNTDPVIENVDIDLENNTMTVTASDNQYIAAVGLYNKTGTRNLSSTGAKQDIGKGESAEFVVDLSEVNGKKFLLQVFDYAMNVATYEIAMQIGEAMEVPEMMAFDLVSKHWTYFDKNFEYSYQTGTPRLAYSDFIVYAGTVADHYVFASTDEGDLYVMPEDDLTDTIFIDNLGTVLYDMAYCQAHDEIYGVDEDNQLVTIHKLNGSVTVIGEIGVTTNTLAVSPDGTFYCNELGTGKVYSFTLDTLAQPTLFCEDTFLSAGDMGGTVGNQTMEYNAMKNIICWNSHCEYWGYITYAYYYEIDPATGEMTRYNDFWHEMTSLLLPVPGTSDSDWAAPTDQVTEVRLNKQEIDVILNTSAQLVANVQPWTASDRTVSWTSSDESIATVNTKGIVTGLSEGTVTITATSNLDPAYTAECVVHVKPLEVTLTGTVQDTDGTPMFYSWNMKTDETWTPGAALSQSMTSATYSTLEDVYYIMDSVSESWQMHKVSPDGTTLETVANPNNIPLWDMSYSEYFSQQRGKEQINSIYYYYLLSPKDPMDMDAVGFDLSSMASYLVAITSKGHEQITDDNGVVHDSEHLVLLDNDGYVWDFWIYDHESGGMDAMFAIHASDLPCEFPGDDTMENMYTSLMVGGDGALYLSTYNGSTNEIYHLSYDVVDEAYNAVKVGDMGNGVWPATITSAALNEDASGTAAASPVPEYTMASTKISAEALASATVSKNADKGNLNTLAVSAEEAATKQNLAQTLMPMSDTEVAPDEKTVTVNVTNDTDATNGVTTVTWDASKLTLIGVVINADYTAKLEGEGTLTFGYVDLDGIPAGDNVATLAFTALASDDSTVTVEHKEVGNGNEDDENLDVEFPHANTEVRGAVEPTCTEPGYTGDTYCTDCGALVKQGAVIPATGHTFGEWTVTTEPGCTEPGEKTRSCTECGETETAEVPATGHTYEDGTCTGCGETQPTEAPTEKPTEKPTAPQKPGKPDTGDQAPMAMLMVLVCLSAFGIAVLVPAIRKKH